MMRDTLMKCGHTATGIKQGPNGVEIPACVICLGITPDAEIVADNEPDLEGREAHCTYLGHTFKHKGRKVTCTGKAPSRIDLAFFEHKPASAHDEFYCGCWGWD